MPLGFRSGEKRFRGIPSRKATACSKVDASSWVTEDDLNADYELRTSENQDAEAKPDYVMARIEMIRKDLRLPDNELSVVERHFAGSDAADELILRSMLQKLQEHKNRTVQILRLIRDREDAIKEFEACERLWSSECPDDRELTQKLNTVLNQNGFLSVLIINSIEDWRTQLSEPYPFMWRSVNYLLKIHEDHKRISCHPLVQSRGYVLLTESLLLPPSMIHRSGETGANGNILQLWVGDEGSRALEGESIDEVKPVLKEYVVSMPIGDITLALQGEATIRQEKIKEMGCQQTLIDTPVLKDHRGDVTFVSALLSAAHRHSPGLNSLLSKSARANVPKSHQKIDVRNFTVARADELRTPAALRPSKPPRPASAPVYSSKKLMGKHGWSEGKLKDLLPEDFNVWTPGSRVGKSTPENWNKKINEISNLGDINRYSPIPVDAARSDQSSDPLEASAANHRRPASAMESRKEHFQTTPDRLHLAATRPKRPATASPALRSNSNSAASSHVMKVLRDLFVSYSRPIKKSNMANNHCKYNENSGHVDFGPDVGNCYQALLFLGIAPFRLQFSELVKLYHKARRTSTSQSYGLTFHQFCALMDGVAAMLRTTLVSILTRPQRKDYVVFQGKVAFPIRPSPPVALLSKTCEWDTSAREAAGHSSRADSEAPIVPVDASDLVGNCEATLE